MSISDVTFFFFSIPKHRGTSLKFICNQLKYCKSKQMLRKSKKTHILNYTHKQRSSYTCIPMAYVQICSSLNKALYMSFLCKYSKYTFVEIVSTFAKIKVSYGYSLCTYLFDFSSGPVTSLFIFSIHAYMHNFSDIQSIIEYARSKK